MSLCSRQRFALASALTALAVLTGCATAPSGPSVMVLPGSQKNFDQFQVDAGVCQQYAQTAIGGATPGETAINNAAANTVASTLIGAAVGAAFGAVTGQAAAGAAIGGGMGLFSGAVQGNAVAGLSYAEAQRRYNMAYTQCMFARGNQVPANVAVRPARMAPSGAPPAANNVAPPYPPANTPPPVGMTRPAMATPPVAAARPPSPPATGGQSVYIPAPNYPTPNYPPSLSSSGSARNATTAPNPARPIAPPGSSYPPPDTPPPVGLEPPLRG